MLLNSRRFNSIYLNASEPGVERREERREIGTRGPESTILVERVYAGCILGMIIDGLYVRVAAGQELLNGALH